MAAASLGGLLREARAALAEAGIADAALDARVLIQDITATTRSDAIARPDQPVADEVAAAVRAAVRRRAGGEPVHRILGARDFFGLRLGLSPDTLEPRPDTEALVELVLPEARRLALAGTCRILDLGTGTGAIALALVAEVAGATAVLADISEGALSQARANAQALALGDRVRFVRSNWFDAIDGQFELIVSNPPYIPSADIGGLDREVRGFDPLRALDGGEDGLDAYRAIAVGAGAHLAPGGTVGVEIGIGQGPDVSALFAAAGLERVGSRKDLGGHERALAFHPRF